jgi:glycosyltransferase involved in cell wall biosynthesis
MSSHVTICVCTYQRPVLLARLLDSLAALKSDGSFTWSVVVVDNDAAESARAVVEQPATPRRIECRYFVEPEKNIAKARNRTLANARGEFFAFLDDDEFPVPDWLALMLRTCAARGADGVLAPVEPHFESTPPAWMVKAGLFNRPRHPTGTWIGLGDARTGNVLMKREVIDGDAAPFDARFGTGGEDVDFFRRKMQAGRRFAWCNEAIAYESVPATRATPGYFLRRALLRGQNSIRQKSGRARKIATSLIALPLYTVALPLLALFGRHRAMPYLIKWCDHLSRLLAVVGVRLVNERDA